MSKFFKRYRSIVQPIANDIVRSGFLGPADADKWAQTEGRLLTSYTDTMDWDIPYRVDVYSWADGMAQFRWALWASSPDVLFPIDPMPKSWPGEAWGTAWIDARTGFRLLEVGPYRCRQSRFARIDDIDPVMLDSRFDDHPSSLFQ